MIELKTLNDLRKDDCFVDWHLLKKEAIKWMKEFEPDLESLKAIPTIDEPQKLEDYVTKGKIGQNALRIFIAGWIKHFFNITYEELK